MNNLQLPAHPFTTYDTVSNGEGANIPIHYTDAAQSGFTKLELASLMIAQGYIAAGAYKDDEQEGMEISRCSVSIAKAVLEEANK